MVREGSLEALRAKAVAALAQYMVLYGRLHAKPSDQVLWDSFMSSKARFTLMADLHTAIQEAEGLKPAELVGQVQTIPGWQLVIDEWAARTFQHDEYGIAKHLGREWVELMLALGMDEATMKGQVDEELKKPRKRKQPSEEGADIGILLLALFGHMKWDLDAEIAAKHNVNLQRQWGKPDQWQVTEHVEPGPGEEAGPAE